jgi:PAS domain S-box-containing protein
MARILVVDDHPDNRDLAATLLHYRGHTVLEAADGAEGLAIIRAGQPDLVITDLLMPVMDGYEFVRELRADPALAATRVIFYTANYMQDEIRPVAAALGVHHIVARPVEAEVFLAAVDAALAAEPSAPPMTPHDEVHKRHLRALSAKLAQKVRELEAAEVALKESEARFRSLAESSPVGIFSLDHNGSITYSNPRLREICGLTGDPEPMPAFTDLLPFTDLLQAGDRDRTRTAVATAIETGGPYRDRVRIVRPGGGQCWADIQAAPVADDSDHVGYVGTVDDVTAMVDAQSARADMEARLRIAERLEGLGQLAGGVAHDFNNLLGAMLNYADFISADIDELAASVTDPRLARMRDDIAAIRATVDRAADLTHQLLIFGRREIIHPEVLDVNEIVSGVEKLLARTIGEHIKLDSQLASDLSPVSADRGRLEQVIVNLVVNARDAIADTGTVVITTDNVGLGEQDLLLHPAASPGRYTRITVTDDGEGMTPETAARVFEPFFTTKPKGKGTGLGLATVHGIVSQLGGHIGIYSEPGRGTSMRVYLPSAAGEPARRTEDALAAPAGHGEAVLVVEDNAGLLAVTTRILEQNGYSVLAAADAKVALALLENASTSVDLLLTDVVMPETSGTELAERTARLRPALPILFMSGYACGLTGPDARVMPGVDLIDKPFTRSTLLRRVAQALGSRQDAPAV